MAANAKIAVTWLEMILVLLLTIGGLGSWRGSRQLAEQRFEPAQPQREDFELRHRVGELHRRHAAIEEEWQETFALTSRQYLEVEQQTAQMEVLERGFAATRAGGSAEPSAEALLEHQKARDRRAVAEQLEERLKTRLHAIEQRLVHSSDAVEAAHRAAASELKDACAGRERKFRLQMALAGTAGIGVFFLAAFAVLAGGPFRKARLRSGPVAAVTAAALLVLILYEALGASALALGSLAALVALRSLFAGGSGDA
jgi:hypothetical protein